MDYDMGTEFVNQHNKVRKYQDYQMIYALTGPIMSV